MCRLSGFSRLQAQFRQIPELCHCHVRGQAQGFIKKWYLADVGGKAYYLSAGGGFIFHGVSGSNKQTTNFLDIYRAADGKYLGSVRVAIGEIESAVVGNDGYLQILVNTPGKTDYVWRTPLNVNELRQ